MTIQVPQTIAGQLEVVSVMMAAVSGTLVTFRRLTKDTDVEEEFDTSALPNANEKILSKGKVSYFFDRLKEVAYLFYEKGYDVSFLDESGESDSGTIWGFEC